MWETVASNSFTSVSMFSSHPGSGHSNLMRVIISCTKVITNSTVPVVIDIVALFLHIDKAAALNTCLSDNTTALDQRG